MKTFNCVIDCGEHCSIRTNDEIHIDTYCAKINDDVTFKEPVYSMKDAVIITKDLEYMKYAVLYASDNEDYSKSFNDIDEALVAYNECGKSPKYLTMVNSDNVIAIIKGKRE